MMASVDEDRDTSRARAEALAEASRHAPYPSPAQRAVLMPLFRGLRAWFRARAHGLDELRRAGPCLLVAKHPRGWLYAETMLLGFFTFFDDPTWPEIQVMEKRGTSLHRTPLVGWLRRNVNTIPATEEAGVAALQAGRSVLVFPGGARELHGEADVVRWGGHRGFARVAARAGVPVVPLAIAGADRQHPWRLRLGSGSTLWLPPLPVPVRLDYWFGAPMTPPAPDDAGRLGAFAEEVAAATQALLDRATIAQGRSPAATTGQAGRVEADGP
jgi:1-acyl-sn-glycerol-3-phosphate acyltransferase